MRFSANARFARTLTVAAVAVSMTAVGIGEARAERTIRLDAGSVIPVRLNDSISSSESRKGDTFTATIKNTDGEDYGLPTGTKVDGLVTGARPQRDKDPGVLEISFQRIRMPDGRSYAIDGSLIGLDNKSVDRRPDGRLVAKPSHKNDRLTYAGYGAGAGLVVGLLTRRPVEDAVLGGLLGYGFSALQKGHSDARDVVLKPGTELGVRIDRRATLTSYDDSQDSHSNRDTNLNGSSDSRYRRDEGTPPQDNRYHRDDVNGSSDSRVSTDRQDYGTANRTDTTDVGVMMDDRDIRFESTARPIITRNDVVLVPASPILRAAKIPYTYDGRSQTLRATGTSEPVRVAIGSNIAIVNGTRRVRMEAPAQRINGSVYVPMKFLSIATGDNVKYDAASRTVVITSR